MLKREHGLFQSERKCRHRTHKGMCGLIPQKEGMRRSQKIPISSICRPEGQVKLYVLEYNFLFSYSAFQ